MSPCLSQMGGVGHSPSICPAEFSPTVPALGPFSSLQSEPLSQQHLILCAVHLTGQGCGSLAPAPLCPFLASWLKLGLLLGLLCPRGLLPPSRMAVRPLRHQVHPWPWSQAKLQGQLASLGFMLHPACGPITATLIMQTSKSCKGIIQRKEKGARNSIVTFLLSTLYAKYSQYWEGGSWRRAQLLSKQSIFPCFFPKPQGSVLLQFVI